MLPFAIFLQHHNTFAIFLQHHNTFAIFLQHHNTFAINFATSDHKFPLRKSLSPSLRQTQPRKSRCLHQFEPCGNIKRSFASEGKYLPFHINCQFLKGFLCPTSSRVRKVDCRHSLAKATILKTDQLSGDTLAFDEIYLLFFLLLHYLLFISPTTIYSVICYLLPPKHRRLVSVCKYGKHRHRRKKTDALSLTIDQGVDAFCFCFSRALGQGFDAL